MVHKHNWNIFMKAKFSKSIGKRRLALRRKTTSSSLERDTDRSYKYNITKGEKNLLLYMVEEFVVVVTAFIE